MLHIQAPVLIKIREGITVNLSMSVSHAVEPNLPQSRLKSTYDKNKSPTQSDYEPAGTADTVSFWFVGGTSLCYRVGHEISQEDFNRIKLQMEALQFRTRDDREPSNNKAAK